MPDDSLFIDDTDRYSRLRLIGWWDQQRLAAARVLVVGAGALGNEVLKNLALVGIGHLYLVDFDYVEQSNLARSVLYRSDDCGRPKVAAAADALRAMNPDVRLRTWCGNVISDIGLGLFRDVDLVIACLDNREARLWVNRCCWKTGTPWIDGGIQEINGVVKVFRPPHSACYECAMTENDYRLINLRYSCPLLRREDMLAGKVPTAPSVSSIVAGLQVQEALKLLHGLDTLSGEALVFNGLSTQFYRTRFQFREDCLSHEAYDDIAELPLTSQATPADVFAALGEPPSAEPFELHLERDLVIALRCEPCNYHQPVGRSIHALAMSDARCPRCGQTTKPELAHRITQGSPLANEQLNNLGVPPYDVLRVTGATGERRILLAGDREHVVRTANDASS